MCGILGIVGKRPVVGLLLEGLERLEYRGYDSAGLATLHQGRLERRRREGKLENLKVEVGAHPLAGMAGIGHTRWATHGRAATVNAHPHMTERVALVHNGIIENHDQLAAELKAQGVTFDSETDSEVLVHALDAALKTHQSPEQAVAAVAGQAKGAFAFVALFQDGVMVGVSRSCPLAVGYGDGEVYLGSDALALAPFTDTISYLEDGDMVTVRDLVVGLVDGAGRAVERKVVQAVSSQALTGKGNHRHFMHKEIFEQPGLLGELIASYGDSHGLPGAIVPESFPIADLERIVTVACGTAHYAGQVGSLWLEGLARIPTSSAIASEFRYHLPPLDSATGVLAISQSGETLDTMEALRAAQGTSASTLAVVNVVHSTLARLADGVMPIQAGPEIGVASTKAFTSQLVVLFLLALRAGLQRGALEADAAEALMTGLREIPGRMRLILDEDAKIEAMAHTLESVQYVPYLGRGFLCPLAYEGALKLKEISYIYAEGYPAGELKHGPIALIVEDLPVVVLAPSGPLYSKVAGNIREIQARGGRILLFTDRRGYEGLQEIVPASDVFLMPEVLPELAPILYALPVQLLAYHVACGRGTDIDQPRNLAKSVTVE